MAQNPAQLYGNSKIQTATPAELTLMLYDGAIKFCNIALMAIENGDVQKQNKYITENDLKEQFGDLTSKDIKDIKDEIKTLKKKIREMSEEYEDKGEG